MVELYMKQILYILTLVIFALTFLSSPVSAFYIQGSENISLPAEKKFNETVIVCGNTITIDSTINGDLICAGQNITINGAVTGDIICVGQNLKITGPVGGDIRMAGQTLDFSKTAIVKGDFLTASQTLNLSSTVGRDVFVAAGSINIDPAVKIAGNFDYFVRENSETKINPDIVKGKTTKHLLPQTTVPEREVRQVKQTVSATGKIISAFSFLTVGLFLIFVFKSSLKIDRLSIKTILLGFAVIFLTPILVFILLMTLIGIPLAFIISLLYILGFFVTIPLAAISVGQLISTNRYLSLLVGVALVTVIGLLPTFGWFFGLIFLCQGFGVYFISLQKLIYDQK